MIKERNDEMRSEEKTSNTEPRNDITADELLVLLNKSIEPKSESKSEPRSARPVNADKPHVGALEIDDTVYKSAEDKLRNSDAVRALDDSDLDIDELIEKFINQPKKEREQAAAELPLVDENGEEIVREMERIREAEAIPTVPEMSAPLAELEAEPLDVYVPTEDAQPEPILDEPVTESVFAEPVYADESDEYNVSDEYGNSDENDEDAGVRLVEPVIESETELPVPMTDEATDISEAAFDESASYNESESAADTEKTAVFDISRIKQLAQEGDEDVDRLVEEAFARSETEVFKPVTDEQTSETVYGQNNGEEIDQTDLNLMIAFGMNEELKETVGEDQATAIEEDILQKHEETTQMQAAKEKLEFTSRDQVTEILTQYKSRYYKLIMRIIAAVVLLAGMFVIENYSMIGLAMPSFMRPTSYPVVYAMIDLQIVVICGALVAGQVIEGIKNLISLKPTPESLTAFVLIMSALYTFAASFTAPMEGFALYNLPVVFAVVLALIYEFMNLKRDVLSFNIVSSKKKKFVVTPVSDATESLEREIFNDYVPGDSQIIRVCKTDFVDGFFARVGESRISKPIIGIIIPVVMILAVAFFILSFLSSGSVYDSFTLAFMTIAVTMPLTAFVIYSYPFYKAAKDSYDSDSAIIGETSLGEYSGSSVISFEDKEVFPSGGVKVTSIKVYGNNRIDEIIYSLASAFIKVGGPLADVFSQATHDIGHSDDVELIEVDDDGFTVTIDDIQVYIGKASYMEKKDYEPPYDSESRRQEQNSSLGILFIAFGGQLAAKVYVQYTIDSEFESILAQLYKTGMCVGIKSFDPNIDDLLLAKKIKAMKYPVKVIRSKTVEDIPHTLERCNSGIVSKRSVKALLKTVALCERVSGVIKTNLIVKILAMLIGVVVMVFVYAFGGELALSSLYIMLYQLFWTIPVLVISRLLV